MYNLAWHGLSAKDTRHRSLNSTCKARKAYLNGSNTATLRQYILGIDAEQAWIDILEDINPSLLQGSVGAKSFKMRE
ncbi:uncharacterized protein N7469_002501 [Penicillium citrinum]|uniref:Uncharacterized protein n=1 Tax=Penicillium citrinum TaxID=5077 RepID=A0A9W9TTK6_PENCI|nr:uncharacterized protein N7469_002501 [Penicillium citrinum]KAJ5240910.1 hypothetical protein N7469_002501 [Penicillium citrinum]